MNDKNTTETSAKAPYQSPQLTRVSLRPEEAVLGHCKVAGSGGPGGGSCTRITRCNTPGS